MPAYIAGYEELTAAETRVLTADLAAWLAAGETITGLVGGGAQLLGIDGTALSPAPTGVSTAGSKVTATVAGLSPVPGAYRLRWTLTTSAGDTDTADLILVCTGGGRAKGLGYTDVGRVAAYLGRDLTAAQALEAAQLVAPAEGWLSNRTNRSWLLGATTELYDLLSPRLRLRYAPVSALTSIQTRTRMVGDAWVTLSAGTDYELLDAGAGLVVFVGGYHGPNAIAQVVYTPNLPLPDDIAHAATMLVAHWLRPQLDPDAFGTKQYKVGHDLEVLQASWGIPADVAAIADSWRRPIFA